MSKFINGSNFTIMLVNHIHKKPTLHLQIPIDYTLLDIIEVIKIYTDYGDQYDWKFHHPNDENKKTLSLENDEEEINKVAYGDYRGAYPGVICTYGPMIFKLGKRGHLKYRKVYPTIYLGTEDFPAEEDFIENGEYSILNSAALKRASQEINIDMKPKKYHPEDLLDFDAKLKTYFKNKYKIGGEPNDSYYKEYQLLNKHAERNGM